MNVFFGAPNKKTEAHGKKKTWGHMFFRVWESQKEMQVSNSSPRKMGNQVAFKTETLMKFYYKSWKFTLPTVSGLYVKTAKVNGQHLLSA